LYDSKYREGLEVRIKAIEEREAEKAFLSCQGCRGEIKSGKKKMPDGTERNFSAEQIAKSTRDKFGKRLCLECAHKLVNHV